MLELKQIDLELAKEHQECKVQALVEDMQLGFNLNKNLLEKELEENKKGLVNFGAIKFHGHGFYSDLEVPWSLEAVEYAWLMEILIANINAQLNISEVGKILCF